MTSARTALFLALLVSLALLTVATFEVLERVQAEPSDESVVAQQEGIRVVAEIRGSPNLGDSDGDGVPNSLDNCPAWPNSDQSLPPWPVTLDGSDPDCDGFTTDAENFMGTLPQAACAATNTANDEGPPDAWPVDADDNQFVNLLDVLPMKQHFNTTDPDPGYNPRFDLQDQNGTINLLDVLPYKAFFLTSCAP